MLFKKRIDSIKKFTQPPSLALMYHRVDNCFVDPWLLSVSPENFEEQLQLLKKTGRVRPLSHFTDYLKGKQVQTPFILLTFDDGYIDNFTNAKPLLEKYELPATFFITTGYIGSKEEFWWDELASLLLQTAVLPPYLSLQINTFSIQFYLKEKAHINRAQIERHRAWDAYGRPISKRSQLYLELWRAITPLNYKEQQEVMDYLKKWAGQEQNLQEEQNMMSIGQLRELAQGDLFTIGAHTHTHPYLSAQSKDVQIQEIAKSKTVLETLIGEDIKSFAYPSGVFDANTIEILKSLGFDVAFTTCGQALHHSLDPYQTGRWQISNWRGPEFVRRLNSF